MAIADLKYVSPLTGADWEVSADDLVQAALTIALSKHIPNWPGATDEQLYAVAQAIVSALDETPQVKDN